MVNIKEIFIEEINERLTGLISEALNQDFLKEHQN